MKTETKLRRLATKEGTLTEKQNDKLFSLWEQFKKEETIRHLEDFCEKNEYTPLEMEQMIEEGTIYLLDGAIIDPLEMYHAKMFLYMKEYEKDADGVEIVVNNKKLDTFDIKLKFEGEK